MAWQTSTVNPLSTTPATDISKIVNDLQMLRDSLGGTASADVPNQALTVANAALPKADNLAALTNKTTARANLGVYSKTEVDTAISAATTPGAVSAFASSSAPAGWLKCNGAAVSRATYAALFTAIGTTFGAGDGSTTFNLPDLRGEFVRGWDDARGIDTGRAFGSAQAGQNASHTHTGTTATGGAHSHTAGIYNAGTTSGSASAQGGSLASNATITTSAAAAHSHTFTTDANGGTEARPRNVALLYCIKF